jgi:citrate lyase synthetase
MYYFTNYSHPSQRQVNQFYKRHKQNASCCRTDDIFITKYKEEIVAALFIRDYPVGSQQTMSLLRSVYVDDNHRKLRLATNLIELACKNRLADTFILVSPQLAVFYQNLGFHRIEQTHLPPVLEKEQKKGLQLMCRPFQ